MNWKEKQKTYTTFDFDLVQIKAYLQECENLEEIERYLNWLEKEMKQSVHLLSQPVKRDLLLAQIETEKKYWQELYGKQRSLLGNFMVEFFDSLPEYDLKFAVESWILAEQKADYFEKSYNEIVDALASVNSQEGIELKVTIPNGKTKYYDVSLGKSPEEHDLVQQKINRNIALQNLALQAKEETPQQTTQKPQNLEPIQWEGSEPQLVYLFEILFEEGLISNENRSALIAKHFVNEHGKPFNNKQLNTVKGKYELNKYGKPKAQDAAKIENIVKELKEK